MPLRLRLQRRGRKGLPFYHIVAADVRSPRDGKYIENIGSYNPRVSPAVIEIDTDKTIDWLNKGAQPTDTVRAILSFKGILYKKHLLRGVKKGAIKEADIEKLMEKWFKEKEDRTKKQIEKKTKKKAELAKKKAEEATAKLKAEAAPAPAAEAPKAEAAAPAVETPKKEEKAPVAETPKEEKKAPEAKKEETPKAEVEAPKAEEKPAAKAEVPKKEKEAPAKEEPKA